MLELVLVLMLSGAIAGLLAGLYGVGGGLVVVPTVYQIILLKGVDSALAIAMAVSTSLVCIIPTALASSMTHYRLNNFEKRLVVKLMLPLCVGAILGALLIQPSMGVLLTYIFVALVVFNILRRLFQGSHVADNTPSVALKSWKVWLFLPVGGLSAMGGIGGGTLGGPLLMAMGVAPKRAMGTASIFGVIIAVPSVVAILIFQPTPALAPWGTYSLIYWPCCVVLTMMMTSFAPLGARLNQKLSPRFMSDSFLVLLMIIAVSMLLR